MLEFAKANPGYTFLIVWVLAWAATRPFWYAWVAYNRTLRSRNIVAHGWPTAPVDADGDVVYPKNDD
jgi:hypothetical protein